MKGFQLTFFTQQDRKHAHMPLSMWLIEKARDMGIHGATMSAAAMGFGREGILRSAGFIELANQPVEITMAVSDEETEALFRMLKEEKINIFYIKAPIAFGMSGEYQSRG